ncbi:MAG: hypothetical protein A3D74_02635 [Candidatus Levybacteria bacterium RIFCSPHIGHO2_02_FULL_37_13]|nr:MAG: hypothetical protein A3D74_02635 [Candidatus Levybacteria bacterium RIFCSPHIGHO2_02_FULL_37_13]
MNPNERTRRQPIRDLVPTNISLDSPEGIKNLPHLQKVAGLVFLLLEGKVRSWQQSSQQLNEKAQSELERLKQEGITPRTEESEGTSGLTTFELLVNSDWRELRLSTMEHDRKDIPKIIADKLHEHGDPFGFGPETSRAILEMANDAFETQLSCDSIKVGTYDPEWNPDPRDYLEEVMIRIYEEGMLSGLTPFSHTKFPAGQYHGKIFPREVRKQMQDYINQMYPIIKTPPDKRLSL